MKKIFMLTVMTLSASAHAHCVLSMSENDKQIIFAKNSPTFEIALQKINWSMIDEKETPDATLTLKKFHNTRRENRSYYEIGILDEATIQVDLSVNNETEYKTITSHSYHAPIFKVIGDTSKLITNQYQEYYYAGMLPGADEQKMRNRLYKKILKELPACNEILN